MTTATTASPDTQLRVRMHRQGLGDCFLVSLLRPPPAPPFHMLIDCGVILGTPEAAKRLQTVVKSVIAETNGYVDVLVVTHEHYDHVAGFVLAKDLFAVRGDGEPGKLSVGQVWFAWTEDPGNALAGQLRAERQSRLKSLAAMSNQLHLAGANETSAPSLQSALNFFGVAQDGSGLGDTAQAMVNAAGFAPSGQVKYHQPGARLTPAEAPELRIYVLGPPMDRASLMKTDSATEVYHLDADDLASAVRVTAGGDDLTGERMSMPFDPSWALSLADLEAGRDQSEYAEFFHARYFGPRTASPAKPEMSWRRIDGAWVASTEALALALDSATNNTSLVLAIEVVESGKVLLFAADAQVGNWLSWQGLSWAQDNMKITAADLLSQTAFYKVGHHGSHNATLRSRGLELMPKDGLVAFIPVDHDMAVRKGWGQMPLPALVDALRDRCGDHLIRVDEELTKAIPGVSQAGDGGPYGSLFYDWTLPL